MLKRTCCPGWIKAYSRIMKNVPRIAAVDQHNALAVTQEVKAHHRRREDAILLRLSDIYWRGVGRYNWWCA